MQRHHLAEASGFGALSRSSNAAPQDGHEIRVTLEDPRDDDVALRRRQSPNRAQSSE
jgi:hypothetical protein